MFKRILVPLDGSEKAEYALPVAAHIARAIDGSVILVRVINTPSDQEALPQDVLNASVKDAWQYLESIAGRESLAGVHTALEVMTGPVAETIVTAANPQNIDLVLLYSHGYTGMTRWVMGSVAEYVARRAPVPVLVIRERSSLPPALHLEGTEPIRVLVPLDGSERGEKAILPAVWAMIALSSSHYGLLHLARVVVLPGADQAGSGEREEIVQEAQAYLQSVAGRMQEILAAEGHERFNLSVTTSVTVDEDVALGIVRLAECGEQTGDEQMCQPSHLIAMATLGQSGEKLWARGSVTGRVLEATRLPLLIL